MAPFFFFYILLSSTQSLFFRSQVISAQLRGPRGASRRIFDLSTPGTSDPQARAAFRESPTIHLRKGPGPAAVFVDPADPLISRLLVQATHEPARRFANLRRPIKDRGLPGLRQAPNRIFDLPTTGKSDPRARAPFRESPTIDLPQGARPVASSWASWRSSERSRALRRSSTPA